MAPPKKPANDRAMGEIMLNEVFKVVQRLNAAAGPGMAAKGVKSGNLTFNPKITVDEAGDRLYLCYIEIYTQKSLEIGPEISMEFSGTTIEFFKQGLKTAFTALQSLAKENYLSDTFTVGLIRSEGEESEIYAPNVLEPGMYSLSEEDEA